MAARKPAIDDEIQKLYRSSLDEFVAGRNALSARLRKEGEKKEAAEVKALAKPTPSAWAVNALFERQPEKMEALLGAGQKARAAQREAVSGRGAEALRESIRTARALSDELRWGAGQILAEQGRPPTRTMVERIAANLQALAFSPAAAEEASRGWLDQDLDPPGFEVLAGLQVAGAPVVDLAARREARREDEEKKKPAKAPPPPKLLPVPERSAREAKRDEEERRRQEVVERARRDREEGERVRRDREAEKARRLVAAAEEKADRARGEADSLQEEATQAEKTATEARRQAEAAERTAVKAREKAEKAAERLARAEEELQAAREQAEAAS